MKTLVTLLLIVVAGIWGYNIGAMHPMLENNNQTVNLNVYKEVSCSEIIASDDKLVCEVNIAHEDEEIRIFRPIKGTTGEN